jgi:hypothetical protein
MKEKGIKKNIFPNLLPAAMKNVSLLKIMKNVFLYHVRDKSQKF